MGKNSLTLLYRNKMNLGRSLLAHMSSFAFGRNKEEYLPSYRYDADSEFLYPYREAS
jgi:hypothetical protein